MSTTSTTTPRYHPYHAPPSSSRSPFSPPPSSATSQRTPSSSWKRHQRQKLQQQQHRRDTFYNINWCFTPGCLPQEMPSIRQTGGCTAQEDKEYRKALCGYIQEAGMKLRSPQMTIATAVVFFHRFFAIHSFKNFDRYVLAATCLFLAGKAEDTFRKARDVVIVTEKLKYKNLMKWKRKKEQEKAAAEGTTVPPDIEAGRINYSALPTLKTDSSEHEACRQQIFQMERILLQTLGFDLKVEHPYRLLVRNVKSIGGDKNLTQVAWNFVNDTFRTALCLQYRPREIAGSAVYLAARFLKHELPMEHVAGDETHPAQTPWWVLFRTVPSHSKAICNEILDLYTETEEYKEQFQNLRLEMQRKDARRYSRSEEKGVESKSTDNPPHEAKK